MISLLSTLVFGGCFLVYTSSRKNDLAIPLISGKKLLLNITFQKIFGGITLGTSLLYAIFFLGTSSGMLVWLATVMIAFSLLIILIPIRITDNLYVLLLFSIIIFLEFLFT